MTVEIDAVPLIRTKLQQPRTPGDLVPRPQLIERLECGLDRKLILVSAPAGFGKTTLVSAWAQHHEPRLRVAWLSLDEGDNDPARFLAYLVRALQTIDDGLAETVLVMSQSPQPFPLETALTAIINEIATLPQDDHQGNPFVLVLDDYHHIESQSIHNALAFLLDHLPADLHLVMTTRVDPPLSLARLRARDQLVEIRASDLSFTSNEAATLLNEVMGLSLAADDIAALENRTEGWITGLHLAALALRTIFTKAEQTRFVQVFSGSHRYVLDYLVEEVLSQQSAEMQAFLRQTAVLDRLAAPLCDAITGRNDSQAVLATLEQANLFLVPLDDQRHWYRYHHLFATLLRAQGRDEAQQEECHRRAAAWYQAHGSRAEAFEHWIQAGAFPQAAALLEAEALSFLDQGQTALVLSWINRLPPDLVANRPWLLVYRAWGLLLTGQAAAVPACLQQAEQAAAGTTLAEPELAGHIAAIGAYVAALGGDVSTTISLAEEALAQLSRQSLSIRSVVAFVLGGMRLMTGEVAAAQAAFVEAAEIGQVANNRHLAVPASCAVASLQASQGQLHQARATYHKALDLAMTPGGRPLPLAAQPCDGLAQLACEQNDLEAASQWLERSLELCRQWPNPETTVSSLLTQATLCLAQGDLEAALAACEEARAVADSATLDPLSESQLAAKRAELLLASGNVAGAARLAADRNLSADAPIRLIREAEQIVLARVLLAQGRIGEAQALLAGLVAAAEKDGRTASLIRLLALQAVAYQARRNTEQARQTLSHALSLAEPEGFVRIFLDGGQPLATLLGQLPSTPFRDRLLTAFDVGATSQGIPLIEPISERELEVLRLISAGFSNRAVAEELVVALGTVKAHTAAIYRKLDVSSRTQAVARARELGLIP